MQKKQNLVLSRLFSLLLVFLLLASTTITSGQLLGYNWQKKATETETETETEQSSSVKQSISAPNEEEMSSLGLEGKTIVPLDSMSWKVIGASKQQEGFLVSSALQADKFYGYNGSTPIFIFLDNNHVVKAVVASDKNDETPSFYERATQGVLSKWNGLKVKDAIALEVDVVSGATYSSQSLIDNFRTSMAIYEKTTLSRSHAPVVGWPKTIALFVVFGIGLVVAFLFKKIRWMRTLVLVLNTAVTGFWCGQFLSFSILRGMIQNGTDFILYLPTVVMLVLAIVMPYFKKKNYYCLWMCPYGSLQELAWKLPVPKVKMGAKAIKMMHHMRHAILAILLILLWTGVGMTVLEYEPFSAFIIATAAPAVMILAGAFVLIGIVIPHPWCQCCCPVGAILNLAEKTRQPKIK